MTKNTKQPTGKLRGRAPNGDPMKKLRDPSTDDRFKIRIAVAMLTSGDARALPYVQEFAKKGTPQHSTRAEMALMRYAKRATAKIANAANVKREPMKTWLDAVDALPAVELMNFTPGELKAWLKNLHDGGVERRDKSRKWNGLLPRPQIILDYVVSMDEEDNDQRGR